MKSAFLSPLLKEKIKKSAAIIQSNFLKFTISPYFSLILLSAVLTLIWFSKHTYQMSGEEIFEIYNPLRSLRLDSNPWIYLHGSNLPTASLYLARLPFLLFASFFYLLGIPGWIIQAGSYFLLMTIGVIGVALFVNEITEDKRSFIIPFIAGAFYLLNPYSMTQVWGRFIYNGMFAWALLPIVLVTIYKWLYTGRKVWLLLFGIFSLLLSHTYANPGFIVAIWLPLFTLMGLSGFKYLRKKISLNTMLFRTGITLSLWILFNIWWIYPYAAMWMSVFSQISSWQENFGSLSGVSQYFTTGQIILLKQKFLFQSTPLYMFWFHQWWILAIEWIIVILVFIGIIVSINTRIGLYLSSLLFISWVFVKGTNPPLGELFYTFIFKNFSFMGAIRNPYEKMGIDFLFAYSILFSLGFVWLLGKIKKLKVILLLFLFLFVFGFSVMPMWTGQMFGGGEYNSVVSVPKYYTQANRYLNSIGNGNLFHLPYLSGDGMAYTWGFNGAEPSEFLFDRTSISKILRVKYYDDIYLELGNQLNNKNFPKLLGLLGVENIILHKDEIIGTDSAGLIRQSVKDSNSWNGVLSDKKIGKLDIYSLDKNLIVPIIYSPKNIVYANSLHKGINYLLHTGINPVKTAFVTKKLQNDRINRLERVSLTYRKLSLTHYEAKIYGAKKDYLLVLNDVYNDNWSVSIDNKPVYGHILINGFSNGWIISKKGSYTISLRLKIWPWE